MGIRRTEGGLASGGGPRLFRRSWLGEAPERILLLVHGFGEHSGRYEHVGSWFAERGAVVHGYDHRGHGRSQGHRNHVDRFDDFLDDLDSMLTAVRGEHPGLPVTIVGHSMGGLISTAFVRERKPEIASLVLSGPALGLGPAMRGTRALALRGLAPILPRLRMASGLPADGLSRDPEVVRRYQEDPLVDTHLTLRLALEMMRGIERTAGGGQEIEVPTLALHGEDDPLCPAEASRALYESLPTRSVPGSALRIYPGLRHEIFNEPEQEQVFGDLLGWLEETRGAGDRVPRAGEGVS